jgi:hypothetical protein
MADEETRKVTILWEVEDGTQPGLDAVARRQQRARDALARGSMGAESADASTKATRAAAAEQAKIAKQLAAEQAAATKLAAAAQATAAKTAAAEQAALAKATAAEQASAAKQLAAEQAEAAKASAAAQIQAARQLAAEQALLAREAADEVVRIDAERKARVTAQVADLEGSAQALSEQQQILKIIGGEEQQIYNLRQKELGLLREAALVQGDVAKARSISSTATVERVSFSSDKEAKAAAEMAKLADKIEGVKTPLAQMGEGISNAAGGTKKLAEQTAGVVGKLSGMAGAAGLAVAAIGAVVVATVEWAAATDEIDKKNKKILESYQRMVNHYDDIAASKAAKRVIINEQAARQEARRVDTAEENALAVEHLARMQEIEGGSKAKNQAKVNALMIEALTIRQELVGAATKEGVALGRQIEILEAQTVKSAKGSGSGPSAADRLKAAGEARLQLLGDELEKSKALAELNNTAEREALVLSERGLDLRLAELELERQVLDVTRAKNSVERMGIDNRKAQIDREAEVINIEARIEARRIESEQRQKAGDLAQSQLEQEGRGTARIIDLESRRMGQATERARMELAEAARISGLTGRRDDLIDVEEAGLRVYQLSVAQMGQEAAAAEKLLDIREAEIRSREAAASGVQFQDELEQVAHDRKLARAEAEMNVLRAADAEQTRLFTAQQARLQQQSAAINTAIGTFESIQGSFQSTLGDYATRFKAEQDEALADWKTNLEDRTKAQSESYDRQIENARGNAGLRRDLERKKAALEKSTQKQIEAAEHAHTEKRKRNEMRFQGIMLLIQGAVQTAKAAAAYPVIPSMVAHGIAAGLNFTYGAMLIAGKVPGGGGSSVGGGGGGSSGTAPSQSDRGSKEVNRVPESVGGRAAERQGGRGRTVGGASGNVTFAGNVTINALGSIDEDAATKIGMAVNQGKHIREGAAIK